MTDSTAQLTDKLQQKIQQAQLPVDVSVRLGEELARVMLSLKGNQFGPETDIQINFINFICGLPWNKKSQDILDLERAKQILDKNHYGLEGIKNRILEYLAVLLLNQRTGHQAKQPVLALVGLVGSGKTSLAYSIAEILGRPIVRLPFGGLGSALQLRGESKVKPEAEPGLIMKALKRASVNNPVILLDEVDRVAEAGRADIMGVLVELLDPEQNSNFLDHYVGFSFDLSQVLFIATANNTGNIATAVLDRLEIIEMPFYNDEQKIMIGKNYLLPQSLTEAGLDVKIVQIDDDTWPAIVRPLGFDGGIRSLKRSIDLMVRKFARMVVEGRGGPFEVTTANLHEYLPL